MVARTSLVALLVIALAALSNEPSAMHVRAIQHSGWWEIRYPDGTVAANELHIPAQRRVTVEARLDRAGILWFNDGHLPRIGRGANATFRNTDGETSIATALHARQPHKSDLMIVGDARFDTWIARQRAGAPMATNAWIGRGKDVFLTARCTLCHTVRGVAVAEQPIGGPDLTHIASRRTIAAGTVPNRTGFLAGWIVDPENLKPGAGMPVNNIDSTDLQALLAFLRTLQ